MQSKETDNNQITIILNQQESKSIIEALQPYLSKSLKNEKTCIYKAKHLANDIRDYIYSSCKARVMNIIESQIENEIKIKACKSILEDVVGNISEHVYSELIRNLGDWQKEEEISCKTCKHGKSYWCSKFGKLSSEKDKEEECKNNNYKDWECNYN